MSARMIVVPPVSELAAKAESDHDRRRPNCWREGVTVQTIPANKK